MQSTSGYSPIAVDSYLWSLAKGAGELDFLRGVHSVQGISAIKQYLLTQQQAITRVSSIWLDKFPIAQPTANSRCSTQKRELGDLAIVTRQTYSNVVEIRMWILQGKVAKPGWLTTGSSAKEIELYEQVPEFDLYTSAGQYAGHLGTFELQKNFALHRLHSFRFWSYLFFEPSPNASAISPIHANWSAQSPHWQDSFVSSIATMITNPGSGLARDTDVDPPRNAEWTRLYHALWNHAANKPPARLPGGPQIGPWIHSSMNNPADDPGGGLGAYEMSFPDENAYFATTGFAQPGWKEKDLKEMVAQFAAQLRRPPPDGPAFGDGDNEGGGPGINMLIIDLSELGTKVRARVIGACSRPQGGVRTAQHYSHDQLSAAGF